VGSHKRAGSNSVGGAESSRSGAPAGREDEVAARAVAELAAAGGRVVDLARDVVSRHEPPREQRLDLPLVETVEAVDRLFEPQLVLGGGQGVAQAVGEGGEVPHAGENRNPKSESGKRTAKNKTRNLEEEV
jgi:hypothetical protein